MRLIHKILSASVIVSVLLLPSGVFALQLPISGNDLAAMSGLSAQAYIVQDVETGQILLEKNADQPWTPASLTKLVTALVVLDTKPKLSKIVTMTSGDQVVGGCNVGGACIRSQSGVKFTVDGLFHAALIPSANNATAALARSTGLSAEEFAAKMNEKAAELGAKTSYFMEPTGMEPANRITARDYAGIVRATFSNTYLSKIAGLQSYTLRSSNNSRYNQTIKNTDKLLGNGELEIVGAKTGYLNESGYNFAALFNYHGRQLAVVVLGEQHLYTAFAETKKLADLAEQARALAWLNSGVFVLGTSTGPNMSNR